MVGRTSSEVPWQQYPGSWNAFPELGGGCQGGLRYANPPLWSEHVSPTKCIGSILATKGEGIMSGAFGVWLDHKGGGPMNGIGALMKETVESSLAPLPCEGTVRRCCLWTRKKFSPERDRAGTLIRTSSLQNYEKSISLFINHPVYSILL